MAQQKRDYVLKAMLEKKILLAVSGLSSAEVDGLTINFTFTDGSTDSMTFEQPADGEDGVSITDVEIDASSHLIVTLSDESTIDAGALPSGITVKQTTGQSATDVMSQKAVTDALSELSDSMTSDEYLAYLSEHLPQAEGGSY